MLLTPRLLQKESSFLSSKAKIISKPPSFHFTKEKKKRKEEINASLSRDKSGRSPFHKSGEQTLIINPLVKAINRSAQLDLMSAEASEAKLDLDRGAFKIAIKASPAAPILVVPLLLASC